MRISLGIALTALSVSVHAAGLPILTVYKDPNCGCCAGWIQYMQKEGFSIKEELTADGAAVATRLGVPASMQSCHTAVVKGSGQVISGHVPAAAVQKLLASPNVKGVAVPGMPMNSPGMGKMDGNLVTVDFSGNKFSQD